MFNNTVGKAASTITGGATQNVGNILNGKGNIGDLLNIGMFAGTGGIGNISKLGTGDLLNFLPMLMGGQQGGQGGGLNFSGDLAGMAGNLSQAELLAMLQRYPQMLQAKDRAYQGLSESETRATANSLGNQAQARGAEAGRANANSLLGRGYASSVADSARLQGRNQGVQQANNISASLLSPQNQAQNALMQSQVYSSGNLQGGGLNSLFALQNAGNSQRIADTQYNASRPPTFLETLLGVGGQVLPHILNPQSSNTVTGTKAGSKAGNVWLGTKAGKK